MFFFSRILKLFLTVRTGTKSSAPQWAHLLYVQTDKSFIYLVLLKGSLQKKQKNENPIILARSQGIIVSFSYRLHNQFIICYIYLVWILERTLKQIVLIKTLKMIYTYSMTDQWDLHGENFVSLIYGCNMFPKKVRKLCVEHADFGFLMVYLSVAVVIFCARARFVRQKGWHLFLNKRLHLVPPFYLTNQKLDKFMTAV
jgi:hypothetical protein